jgi:hypothetical protein
MPVFIHDFLQWDQGYVEWAKAFQAEALIREYCNTLKYLMLEALESVPRGGKLLIISHGGIVEASMVAALPGEDFSGWGGPAGHFEGAELLVESDQFVSGKPLA